MKPSAFLSRAERYFFAPQGIDYLIALIFLPLSLLYTLLLFIRYLWLRPQEMELPVISIGNLVMGGSGKTPVTIALARRYEGSVVVLRGYGRASEGTIVISDRGRIEEDVTVSGDEAMLLAQSLPQTTVIVASDRIEGIQKAKAMGAKLVFLDDGYSKHFIKKLDLLLEPKEKPFLPFCLPSGPYREWRWPGKKAVRVIESVDFSRKVTLKEPTERMLLVTAISKPWRLDPYLPEVVGKETFIDHYSFKKEELESLMRKYDATSILTTGKDAVKMENFGLPLSILDLDIQLSDTITDPIENYIKNY